MVTDDLAVPTEESGGLDDHQAVQQLCLLHSHAREQQSQLIGAAQPWVLSQLALQDEHLLAKGQDLAVAIITEQLGDQGSKGREQHEKQMPEHAGRMTGLDGEVSSGAGRLERGDSGSPDHRD